MSNKGTMPVTGVWVRNLKGNDSQGSVEVLLEVEGVWRKITKGIPGGRSCIFEIPWTRDGQMERFPAERVLE